jgi:hypothetical protein
MDKDAQRFRLVVAYLAVALLERAGVGRFGRHRHFSLRP